MKSLLAVALLLLPLSAPFGAASATATSVEDGLQLEVSVEVHGDFVAVLVRGRGEGGSDLPPVALGDKGGGTWAGIVQLPVVDNILVGFEAIPSGGGEAVISELHSLTELGVDRAVFEVDNPQSSFGEDDNAPLVSPEGRRWGWLGLAAGAAALTVLALWTIGSVRGDRDSEDAEDEAVEDETDDETDGETDGETENDKPSTID